MEILSCTEQAWFDLLSSNQEHKTSSELHRLLSSEAPLAGTAPVFLAMMHSLYYNKVHIIYLFLLSLQVLDCQPQIQFDLFTHYLCRYIIFFFIKNVFIYQQASNCKQRFTYYL